MVCLARKREEEEPVMKIKHVQTFVVGVPAPFKGGINWVFVKLGTDDGVEGWGECNAAGFREKTLVQLVKELSEHFLIDRQSPFDIEMLWGRMYGGDDTVFNPLMRHPGTVTCQALAAIEMACWDIVGKSLNQPVYNLLGGQYHKKLRSYTYMHYEWHQGDAPEKAGEAATRMRDAGFSALKLDPIPPYFPAPRELSLTELKYAEAVIRNIRAAVGSSCDILIGTHGQLTTHSALRFAKMLEPFDPLWFEEPVPLENIDEMARVAASTTIPIATGERLATKWEFRQLFEKQAAQIIQMNVGFNGILESKKIAAMAEAHYAQIAPWMHCGPIAGAAAIQLDVCSPNFLIQEGLEKWDGFHADILKEPIQWEKGYLIPSGRPGLGVEPDERVLAKHPPHEYSGAEVQEVLGKRRRAGEVLRGQL
jgi:2-dehydro-3-deoxyphosphogalactonate aldolase